jgi:hypothetical protein
MSKTLFDWLKGAFACATLMLGQVNAAETRTWYYGTTVTGKCVEAGVSPDEFYNFMNSPAAHLLGYSTPHQDSASRDISRGNTKNGIWATVIITIDGWDNRGMNFFTSYEDCDIWAQKAPS